MRKKEIIFFILFIFLILIAGCETLKGVSEGAKQDWRVIENIDTWIRENLW